MGGEVQGLLQEGVRLADPPLQQEPAGCITEDNDGKGTPANVSQFVHTLGIPPAPLF